MPTVCATRSPPMQFEAFSHPKARDLSVPADDVLLHVPGRVTAVFDGATDTHGRRKNGVPMGRLAAMIAAEALAGLPADAASWDAADILKRLSAAIADAAPHDGLGRPASTTAMIAFETPDALRMVGIGDTGYRVNAGPAQITELAPDDVTISARVTLFKMLQAKGLPPAQCEIRSGRAVGNGLDAAIADGEIDDTQMLAVLEDAIAARPDAAQEVARFLRAGLQQQHRFANVSDHPLGYGVLDGSMPESTFIVDALVSRDGLRSVELFSDGYMVLPDEARIAAWEASHAHIEAVDPHKIGMAPAVKGSTDSAFFDDRTVAILRS